MNHVCANDKQNLMNARLIRANLEQQIVALTSTQSMLRAIKDYTEIGKAIKDYTDIGEMSVYWKLGEL